MRAVAGALGIGPLDLPFADGPRLWRAEDIEAHLPLFKDYAPAAGLLAKAGSSCNMQVRVQAAINTLGVAPEAARRVLEAIRASIWQPQAMDAGMCLRALDDGEYKPD